MVFCRECRAHLGSMHSIASVMMCQSCRTQCSHQCTNCFVCYVLLLDCEFMCRSHRKLKEICINLDEIHEYSHPWTDILTYDQGMIYQVSQRKMLETKWSKFQRCIAVDRNHGNLIRGKLHSLQTAIQN